MADDIDRAQDTEQADRDAALRAARARYEASFAPRTDGIDGQCIDCHQPIEPERLRALRGCTSRCIACATTHEQRSRGYHRP